LNKHEVISGFFVTMLGVLAAFWLAGLDEQRAMDRTTKQRLHLVVLEAEYNGKFAREIFGDCAEAADPNVIRSSVRRLNTAAATAAFQDAHVLSLLPLHKVSLLNSYLSDVGLLNQALQMHQGVLESQGYKTTPQERDVRQKVRENAADVSASALVLQEELTEYFDKTLYNFEELKRIQDRINFIKEKTLKGEASLSKQK
jgi:hypothetical protein